VSNIGGGKGAGFSLSYINNEISAEHSRKYNARPVDFIASCQGC